MFNNTSKIFFLLIAGMLLSQLTSLTVIQLSQGYVEKISKLEALFNQQINNVGAFKKNTLLATLSIANNDKNDLDERVDNNNNISLSFRQTQLDLLHSLERKTIIEKIFKLDPLSEGRLGEVREFLQLWNKTEEYSKKIVQGKLSSKPNKKLLQDFEDVSVNLQISVSFISIVFKRESEKYTHIISYIQTLAPTLSMLLTMLLSWLIYSYLILPLRAQRGQLRSLIQIMSHDINNPLTVIFMYSKRLMKKLPQLEAPERINKAANVIKEIIEHVLEYQAIDSGKKVLKLTNVNVISIFEAAEFIFKEKLEEKNIDLKLINKTEDKNFFIQAEESSFSNQVFNNLVSNAIKFSREHTEIEVILNRIQDKVTIVISDKGIGIPKSMIKNLFREDKKTSRVGTQGEKGTGFGLPLVKRYIEYYGGRIEVESTTADESPNKCGTDFIITLKAGN